MAKRRNVKKEKAARNRAYARQFQKKSGRGGYKARRFANNNTDKSSDTAEDKEE
ncbi:MAG: hypothetical protein QNJ70_16475 [Xenococcaceae cyanobacterium MO_207.B15]|nr:hypothetical protein [Xenococcaceae cyanobacterium MO_207.B15]MDJ0747735.1 hypothetical protein [Xenococcaceae cyanobacterium MO_167.B27]